MKIDNLRFKARFKDEDEVEFLFWYFFFYWFCFAICSGICYVVIFWVLFKMKMTKDGDEEDWKGKKMKKKLGGCGSLLATIDPSMIQQSSFKKNIKRLKFKSLIKSVVDHL